ncbi:MAG TPA: hypothetical protein VMZ53_25870 [Kofleriaceae bacterium]|nr:hypothetical protein [Kofleriaceae bacterium]
MGRAVGLVVMLALAGCYEQPSETCKITCTPGAPNACPDGLECNPAGLCNVGGASCKGPTVAFRSAGIGARHICGLSMAGDIYCWGDNSVGQVGTGTVGDPVTLPTKLMGGPFTHLAVGAEHSCAMDGSGKPVCWGQNTYGQTRGAGPGTSPAPVETLLGQAPAFDHLSAGGRATCALGNGQLWCWGFRDFTNGTAASQATRVAPVIDDWTDISCGFDHCCGISTSMGALCFGENDNGQLGNSTMTTSAVPVKAGLPAGMTTLSIVAGHEVSCAIVSAASTTEGELWCWGRNTNGTDIIDQANQNRLNPQRMGADADWTSISIGTGYACGQRGRRVYCWGSSDHGGMGNGIWSNYNTPLAMAVDLGEADEVLLHTGSEADEVELACLRNGTDLDCFGDNSYGELATGYTSRRATPVEITAPPMRSWKHVDAGHHHTCATLDDDSVYCWGSTEYGEANAGIKLGADAPCVDGEVCDRARPERMPAPLMRADVITAGDHFSCARDGTNAYCWGIGARGYTGPSSSNPVHTVLGPGASSWVTLQGGDTVTCGLTSSNEYACWGYIPFNQPTAMPLTLPGIQDITQIAFGENFGCVVGTNKVRTCWGTNANGELGYGDQANRNLSGAITVANIESIAADDRHACAVNTDGTVGCWGSNDYRESGSTAEGSAIISPVLVKRTGNTTLSSCTQVSVGAQFSCAVCAGRVLCWGMDHEAELGRGRLYGGHTELAAEVTLPEDLTFIEMSAGHHHSCAISTTGRMYCWGTSLHGQIGDGQQSRNLPTPVGR